jgi:hypothetical protein
MMRTLKAKLAVLGLAMAAALHTAAPAHACGGFFCSSTPVDQNAERIVFKVRDDGKTDMIVQITYQGKAEDFAWLLPLAEPPAKEDLGVFPQLALTALDAQTGVSVQPRCFRGPQQSADAGVSAGNTGSTAPPGVQVFVRTQIGNYDVAVIGSTDAAASAQWLEQNGFRISAAMQGFIKLYTDEGMKFLALKLLPDKGVNDITPFKLTLPGTTPSIPLRLSAVAAEPEMGIVAWVFGKERYEPANATELSIADADLRYDYSAGRSNWTALVARAVDAMQGRGFVVENAAPVEALRQFAMSSFANTEDQMKAQKALLDLFAGTTYMTRLYTRVSPEEMTYDPVFKRSSKGDVSRVRQLPDGDTCGGPTPSTDPCDFVACGALGLCRSVMQGDKLVAACACSDGATARTTFEADSSQSQTFATTVSCVDQRLSYLNPGDRNAAGEALSDPCVGIDCSGHGKCVAMNMTPTCECEHGYAAQGLVGTDGKRSAKCLKPSVAIPAEFYNRRTPPRDAKLPLGRDTAMVSPSGESDPDDPVPEGNMMAMSSDKPADPGSVTPNSDDDSGCSLHPSEREHGRGLALFLLTLLGASLIRLRKRRG